MPTQIEWILDRSMSRDESLRLSCRFELPHPLLSHPGCFMRLLDPIVFILLVGMNSFWDQLGDTVM